MSLFTFLLIWTLVGTFSLGIYHVYNYFKTMRNKDEYTITLGQIICALFAIPGGPITLIFVLIHLIVEEGDKAIFRLKPYKRREDED